MPGTTKAKRTSPYKQIRKKPAQPSGTRLIKALSAQKTQAAQDKPSNWQSWHWRGIIWHSLQVLGNCATISALFAAIYANMLTRESMRQGQIINAWQVLTIRSPGNSGKREALQTLNDAKQILEGIDLSCQTMEGGWNQQNHTCKRPVALNRANLAGAILNSANLIGVELDEANLSNAWLWEANLNVAKLYGVNLTKAALNSAVLAGAIMEQADLSGASLVETNLRQVDLNLANMANANFSNADLSFAKLVGANLSGANLTGTNLSAAEFCSEAAIICAQNITQAQVDEAWAWADQPPRFVAGTQVLPLHPPKLCPIKLITEYLLSGATGKPKGC